MSIKNHMTDMTVGSPAKHIFVFSIPLLFGNIFQQLYNVVDSVVVGNYVGKVALAAVGTGFPLIFMMSSLFMGLGIGATVMIAQFYGARNMEAMKKTIHTIYKSILIGSIPLSILGMVLTRPLLLLTNVPEDTIGQAQIYMLIIFAGLIGNLGFNANAGILQGLGDSRSPLIFLALSCVINIVLDLLFVLVFNWGVAGVAIATVIAQACSWIFGVIFINKKYPALEVKLHKLDFDKIIFKQVMQLGIPSGIQQALFSVGVMVFQSVVNQFGSDFIAGFNAANKIDMFAFLPVQSFSSAVTTYTGQNIGAGNFQRVRQGMVVSQLMCIGVTGALSIWLYFWAEKSVMWFTKEPEVIAAGAIYLRSIMPLLVLLSIQFITNSVMRGAGEMIVPMVSSLVSLWLARIPAAYLLVHFFGRDSMFYSYAIGWVIGVAISLGYYLTGRWKKKAITKSQVENYRQNREQQQEQQEQQES